MLKLSRNSFEIAVGTIITLVAGILRNENPSVAHTLELTLIDELNGIPMPDATIEVKTHDVSFSIASNARGIAVIESPDQPRYLSLRIKKEGFVPKLVTWDLHELNLKLPDQFTLKMERAKTIGGFVRNQAGEPVEGVNVLIVLRGLIVNGVQPRIYNDIWERPASTDPQGKWQFHEATENLDSLQLRLEHPDYISNEHIPVLPSQEEFKNGTAVLTILRGVPCEGTVTDEQGQPLEGVKVIFGEAGAGSPATPTRTTDALGYFHFGGISLKHRGAAPILSFLKEGYTPELVELQPASVLIQRKVVLRSGKSLRVRFTDREGAPIGGVLMAVNYWREHRPFHLRFDADETGLVHWESAPEDAVSFTVLHDSYQRQEVNLTATDNVQTVILQRPTTISGRVVDAQTKQIIPIFHLTKGRYFSESRPAWSDWNYSWVRTFSAGKYSYIAKDPVMMSNPKGGPGEMGFHRLRIDAPGYKPAISRPIANEEEEVECHFELEPGAALEGSVRDAAGSLISHVDLVVAGPGNPVIVRNGEVMKRGHFTVMTDEQGRYALPPQEEDFPIVIAHHEGGYLTTSCSKLEASPHVQLHAWGRLELATTTHKDSQPNYYLRPVHNREHRNDRVRFDSTPVIARDGMWVFEGLVAGPMRLGTYGLPMHDGPVVSIESGKTAHVDLRSGRRTVVGQILLPPEGVSTEEPLVHLKLRTRLPDPPIPPGLNEAERNAWLLAWRSSPEGRNHQVNFSEISFETDFQGHFNIHDVAPGLYRLLAIFFRSLPKDQNSKPDIAGLVTKDFELPTGDGEFDLGPLPMTSPNDLRFGP